MPLAFSERRPRQRPLIVIADISGSMERYSEMLAALSSMAPSTSSTRLRRSSLRRVSHGSRESSGAGGIRVPYEQVARKVPDWSGGTRIGEAVGSFNRNWSRRVGGGGPIALIVSDGWDTGDPEPVRARNASTGSRSVHRVIWLNPLAGHEGFTPEARGMAAALPLR